MPPSLRSVDHLAVEVDDLHLEADAGALLHATRGESLGLREAVGTT